MFKTTLFNFLLLLTLLSSPCFAAEEGNNINQDSITLNQILYKGKAWIGLYYNVHGSEFAFTKEWLNGSVNVNGILFNALSLKYDIYNDNLLINYQGKRVIIIDSESITSFSLNFEDKEYTFQKITGHKDLKGFYQVFHDGKTKLYKKWRKKRAQFAIDAKYDEFQDDDQLYLLIGNRLTEIDNRRGFMKTLDNNKELIKQFLRDTPGRVDIKSPETMAPLLEYYDTLILL